MEATIKIQKWGNGLGISIPPIIANGLSFREGHYVSVHEKENRIIIEHANSNVAYSLTDMLSKITENNIHQRIETGLPVGNEIW